MLESAGRLPPFTAFGTDLEAEGALARVASQLAYQRELIIVCSDAAPTASASNALNTVLQLRALGLHHVLFLSDSPASCLSMRGALPGIACVWSSRLPKTMPANPGLCAKMYWGYAFYFYDLRKHYAARLAIEFGVNVLQTDTDVVWLSNPYPTLKGIYRGVQLVSMSDTPLVNAGVFYAQDVRPGDGAAWVLRELSRRLHLFITNSSAVKQYVPWAQPPYFANIDEQTIMNDVRDGLRPAGRDGGARWLDPPPPRRRCSAPRSQTSPATRRRRERAAAAARRLHAATRPRHVRDASRRRRRTGR